jgi:hypothetical protein
MFEERTYRGWIRSDDLQSFQVIEGETDLLISVDRSAPIEEVRSAAKRAVSLYRSQLKEYIRRHPDFLESLSPIPPAQGAPGIALAMIEAGEKAGVGPMAAVAGAIAEFVAKELAGICEEVIVENGGDIFILSSRPRYIGLYAGDSPFTGKLAFRIDPDDTPLGVCTSSGTVGHSRSFGRADAVTIFAKSAALADAAATAAGNVIDSPMDIELGLGFARSIEGVLGVAIIVGDKIGIWGDIVRLVRGGSHGRGYGGKSST